MGTSGPGTGLVAGFAARGVIQTIGQPGGFLLAFLALSALTLATLAWHPLHRLEKKTDGCWTGRTVGRADALPDDVEDGSEDETTTGG